MVELRGMVPHKIVAVLDAVSTARRQARILTQPGSSE